jgi:undecaprenyl-diphosphatase
MTIWQAAVLGLVQGLTEFLPISSSGHLELCRQILGWQGFDLAFDVALHWGTLLAVLLYFRRDWMALTRGVLTSLRDRRANAESMLAAKLVVGSVPAAVAGVLLEELAETTLRSPWVIVSMLAVVGFFLLFADRRAEPGPADQVPGWGATLLIGLAQAIALVPGTSRSGITMLAGISLGLSRASAARFSFLLSAPIIFGAGLFKLGDVAQSPSLAVVVGFVSAAISGGLAIAFLLRYLTRGSFRPFAIYRIALALAVAALLLVHGS